MGIKIFESDCISNLLCMAIKRISSSALNFSFLYVNALMNVFSFFFL